jgi:hypothetical protein
MLFELKAQLKKLLFAEDMFCLPSRLEIMVLLMMVRKVGTGKTHL